MVIEIKCYAADFVLLIQVAARVVGGLDLVSPRRDGRAERERDRARRTRVSGA